MPEILRKQETEIAKAIRCEVLEKGRELSRAEALRLVQKHDGELVGDGDECVVVAVRGEAEKLVAISYWDLKPKKAKEIFYLQRIFSTLFPHNFPHFYAASGKTADRVEKESISGTIRKRVMGQELTPLEIMRTEPDPSAGIKYPFGRVIKFCTDLSIPVAFETPSFNYIVGDDGGAYYLDTIEIDTMHLAARRGWNLAEIMRYMDEAKYDGEGPIYDNVDRWMVRRSIERLAELGLIGLAKLS